MGRRRRDRTNAAASIGRLRDKFRVYNKLGGAICSCPCGCRVSAFRWLQLDHIHGDGAEDRRDPRRLPGGEVGSGNHDGARRIIREILKMSDEDARERYRVLCANCNISERGGSQCPGARHDTPMTWTETQIDHAYAREGRIIWAGPKDPDQMVMFDIRAGIDYKKEGRRVNADPQSKKKAKTKTYGEHTIG